MTRRLFARVEVMQGPLREELAAVTDRLPALLNTIASQNALAREWKRSELRLSGELEDLRRRLEALDREIAGAAGDRPPAGPEPVVLCPEKIAAANGDLRVNLGCGELPLAGFVNVEAQERPGVDVVAGPARLPFAEASIAHLHSSQLLERLSPRQLESNLAYWRGLLKPGGRLSAVVPELFSPASLCRLLESTGFTGVRALELGEGTAGDREVQVEGRRP